MPVDTLSQIRARGHIGIRLGLGRMRALLARLGDPQEDLHGVLVGGTNGKGSVAAMVATALRFAGCTTGQSPSPHLHSYRERVTIDGRPIEGHELEPLLSEVLVASHPGEKAHGPATEFELLTAAAYLWSARQNVDVMVMEVGLGGRLDASNAWNAEVAAITNVGLEHQEYLGDTVAAVAAEKAAIIKPGARAVTGATGEALVVISAQAQQEGVPLDVRSPLPVRSMSLEGVVLEEPRLGSLRIPLLGRHQAANAAVALGTLEALARAGLAQVSDEAIRAGLGSVRWPGRLEVIEHEGVTVIVDGAHNPDGVAVLAVTLEELAPELPAGRPTLLLGVMRDKEVDEMLEALMRPSSLRGAHCLATSVPETERALPAAELAARWARWAATPAGVLDDVDAALDRGLELAAAERGPLVIAGSLYLVGRLRARLLSGTPEDHDA